MKKLLIIFLMLTQYAVSAQDNTNCLALVKQAIHKMNTPPDFDKAENVSLKYAMITRKLVNGVIKPFKSEAHILMGGHKIYVVADNNHTYQDKELMVSVLHDEKTIYITPKHINNSKELFKNVAVFRDTLFSHAHVIKCEGQSQVTIQLGFEQKVQAITGIEQVAFTIDRPSEDVKKMVITYKSHQIIDVEIDIIQLEKYQGKSPFEGNAISRVLDGNGELKAKYQGYKLIDLR